METSRSLRFESPFASAGSWIAYFGTKFQLVDFQVRYRSVGDNIPDRFKRLFGSPASARLAYAEAHGDVPFHPLHCKDLFL